MKKCRKIVDIFFVMGLCIFGNCGKNDQNKNVKLAQTYYKMCLLELAGQSDVDLSSERKAFEYIQKAIEYRSCAEFLAVKATLLFKFKNFEQACFCFEQALQHNPVPKIRASILNNYACLLAQMGKIEKSLGIFDQLEKDSYYFTPQVAMLNKGKIFFDKMDFQRAEKEFSNAVKIAPDYVDAHYYLALSAFKMNHLELVKKEVDTILFLEPEHKGAIWLSEKMLGNG